MSCVTRVSWLPLMLHRVAGLRWAVGSGEWLAMSGLCSPGGGGWIVGLGLLGIRLDDKTAW